MSKPFIVRSSESRSPELDIFGDLVSIKVSGSDTAGKFAVIAAVTPTLGGPPLHTHISDSESFVVLEGLFRFILNGEEVVASAGDTVHIPPRVVHQYQNIGEQPGRLLLIVEPAGLDNFFVELDGLLKGSNEPDMPAIAALHTKYKMELLGPPLSEL